MAFLEAELHLLRDQLGTFELRMRAIELGNEKAASSTLAIAQSMKSLAGVWLWNSEMQASEYYYLRKKSSTSSSKGPISRYSGWVTDGSPEHHPPSKEQMPSKLLEKFKDLQGYKWYWFKDRWLLFSLHNI
ncbi:hypothetical protein BY996DRAFT_8694386 [Phakopsora pachyrhizi]|nr:hypothetical protein BY996DRAFT_8694386 [Phakopsora pachyrhizi]